jgi:tRNA (guanine10-N2)-dimethyltransferase
MKYFFALGNNPTLSVAELSALLHFKNIILNKNILVADTDEFDATEFIKRCGGTIKIGKIIEEIADRNKLLENILKILNPTAEGKYKFGLSYYGNKKFNDKPIGMEIKKFLKEQGISCRWVISKEKVLSSVVVEQNKLTGKGDEIVLIENGKNIFIGKTLAVQPFKELSFRDYGRPGRDDESGMLPPKLAQIMINLSRTRTKQKNITILDPFCGSGTVLTESILLGYQNLIGSDLSAKAIKDTQANINWIYSNYQLKITNYELINESVISISKKIKSNSIDAIITEPFLGPQRGHLDIRKTTQDLEILYGQALSEFKKILKKDGVIVMLWPVFMTGRTPQIINPNVSGFKIINPIPGILANNPIIKLTDRETIIYGRDGQRVWREIAILKFSK